MSLDTVSHISPLRESLGLKWMVLEFPPSTLLLAQLCKSSMRRVSYLSVQASKLAKSLSDM